jgi:ABC transporter with metal-binding/Fe-S-binding domain ATP-binding protein
MRLAVLFSGGKDSVLAADRASRFHELSCLVTLVSSNPESYMFHTPAIEHTATQAEAMGIPHLAHPTQGVKEEEVGDMEAALALAREEHGIEGVVSGAIESVYQAARVERVCRNLRLWCFNPLWQEDQETVLRELADKGYEVMITGVFAYPLGEDFLGRLLDEPTVDELLGLREKMGFNPAGEGGEIETFVVDGPLFKKPVKATVVGKEYANYAGTVRLETEVEE